MKNTVLKALLVFALLSVGVNCQAEKGLGKQVERVTYGEVEICIYENENAEDYSKRCTLIINRNGEEIVRKKAFNCYLFDLGNDPKNETLVKDITRDGQKNVVVGEFTGHAHCCFNTYIFSLDSPVCEIAKIAGLHSEAIPKDIDGDGIYEFVLNDWTFAYWKVSFAASPAPEVILTYKNGRYVPATSLMTRKSTLSSDELKSRRQEIQSVWQERKKYGVLPAELWHVMLELIYTGNMEEAKDFLQSTWPDGEPGLAQFNKEFFGQLQKSPYYGSIKAMNAKFPENGDSQEE